MSAQPDDISQFLNSQRPADLGDAYADSFGVPREHIRAIMGTEGSGAGATSPKGAYGKMQLMPGTAKGLGVDPRIMHQNIAGGVAYYKQQLDRFGDPVQAAAAYNAGPGAVQKYHGVPPYRETQGYAKRFTALDKPAGRDDVGEFLQGQSAAPADDVAHFLSQQAAAPQATPQAPTFHPNSRLPGGGYTDVTGQPQVARRAPSQAETQLAQLWQNAHDAGDPDAMRSLGRELQQKFGWEYGEPVKGWPYIKPPANFQAAPGVDATASLRATKVPTTTPYSDPRARLAAGLGGGALQGAGELLAGIPNIVAGPIQPLLHPSIQQAIEQNPVSRAITSAGRSVAKKGQEIGAQAGEGFVPDVLREAGQMAPALATGPLGIPAMAVETYAQRRGAGASPLEAGISAGTQAAGLGLGGKIAGKLGGSYLSKLLGYTVGPQAVSEIEEGIRTGKLPDPKQVGERALKNAIFAAGFSAMGHGREAEAQPTADERPQAQPESARGIVDAREAEADAREAAVRQTQEYKDAEAETARLLAASRANPPEITGTRQGPNPVTGTKQDIIEGGRAMAEAWDREHGSASQGSTGTPSGPVGQYKSPDQTLRMLPNQKGGYVVINGQEYEVQRNAFGRVNSKFKGQDSEVMLEDGSSVPLKMVSEIRDHTGQTVWAKSGIVPQTPSGTSQVQAAAPSHADTMAQGSVNSLSEARNIAFRAENGRDPTPDEIANFGHDQTLAARQVQHDAINQSIADPSVKRIKIIAGSPGEGKSTYIEAQPADSHDNTVYYETHFEDPNEVKRVISEAKAAGKDVEVVGVLRGGGPIESYKKVVERADETGKIVSPEYGADLTRSFYGNFPDIANYAREQGVPVRGTQLEGDQTRTLTGKVKMPELPADLEDQYRGLAKESKYADQFLSQGRPGGAGGLESGPRAVGQEPQPIPQTGPQGTEAIPQAPGQGTQEAPQSTGIKHAVVEAERTARGAADIEKLRTSMPETFDRGKAIVDEDPSGWRGKVGQWAEKPTAHSPEEQAALEYDRARLGNERRAAEAAVDSATDPATKAAAQEKLNQIIQHIDNNDQVAIDTGTLWGQQGVVRQQMMKDDYSLTNLERQYKAKGIEVTPDLHKQLADMSAKISDAIDRVNKLEQGKQEWAARAAKPRSEKLTSWKANLKQGADEAMAELKRLGVIERGSGLSTEQLKLAAKWGAYKLGEKGITLAEWTDHMVQTFGEKIREQLPALRQAAYAEYKKAKDDAAWNQSQTPEGKQSALQDIRREIMEGQAQEKAANKAKAQAERLEKQSTIGAAKIQAGIAKEDAAQVAAQQAAEARQRVRDAKERQAQIERLEKQKIAEAAAPRARAQARQTQLQEQLETGNVEPKPRRQFTPDRETQLAQLEVARLKRQVDQKRLTLEEANQTPGEKFRDGAIKLHRSLVVSGLPTMAHVAAQNVWRPLTWLAEDVTSPIARAAMPGVAKAAPSEGRGIGTNLSSTAKGIAKTIRTAIDISQYKRTWKTGQTDIDAQLGRPGVPPSALELFGRLHSILRMPIQAGAYERALARRLSVTADPNDPLQLAPNMVGAYMDAQRDNFMQPAPVTDKIMGALGPAGKFYIPVSRIGTNTATETIRGITGIPEAVIRRAWNGAFPQSEADLQTYAKENNLTEAQAKQQTGERADAIMRALKKGSVGPLLVTLGFAGRGILGGTSQTKEEKKARGEGAIEPKGIRVGPANIPPYAVRAPGWTLVQLGATLGNLMDEYKQQGRPDVTQMAAGRAGMEAASQTVGNMPLVRNIGDIAEAVKGPQPAPEKAGKLAAGVVRSMVIPPDVSRIAKTGIPFTGGAMGDLGPTGKPVERRTEGPLDVLKEGTPFARRGLAARSTYVGNVKVDLPAPIQSITFGPGERKQFLSAQVRSTVTKARDAELKDAYGQLVNRPEYPALTTEQKQAAIKATMTAIDHGYMSKVKLRMKPNHDLADKWTDEADYDVGDIIDKAIDKAQEKQAVNQ